MKVVIKRIMRNCNNCIISDDDDLETINTYSGEMHDENILQKNFWTKDELSNKRDLNELYSTRETAPQKMPNGISRFRSNT